MKNFEQIEKIALDLKMMDVQRNIRFEEYERAALGKWELPPEIDNIPWIHKTIDTTPKDVIATATRVLGSKPPEFKVTPLASSQENRDLANKIERILAWELANSNQRRTIPVQADFAMSSVKYGAIFAQVIDLAYQIPLMKERGQNTSRIEAVQDLGRFVIKTHNPRHVHAYWSDMMLETVLLNKYVRANSLVSEWGAIPELLDMGDDWVELYDYTDYDVRAVWCKKVNGDTQIFLQKPTEWELPFLGWVAETYGSSMEEDNTERYFSLLQSIVGTGQWETGNVLRTLINSEAIAAFAEPRYAQEGRSMEEMAMDAGDPARVAKVPAGDTLRQLARQGSDPALMNILGMNSEAMSASTISKMLMGGDIPSQTAFSTLNMIVMNATGALVPYREVAERALAATGRQMLAWVRETDEPLFALGRGREQLGEHYMLTPDEIPPRVYIDVTLQPDVPIDRMSRINAAMLMVQSGFYDAETAMEELGINDPAGVIKNIRLDKLRDAWLQLKIEDLMENARFERQARQQEMLMAMQQAQQEQAMQAQQNPMDQGGFGAQGGMTPESMAYNAQQEALGEQDLGQGFNAAMGGTPSMQAQPGMGREQVAGYDMMGNPVEGL